MSELEWQLKDWKFKAYEDNEWLTAQVPGCVHTDLLRNKLIPDPFVGTNEKQLQWIDRKDWEYATEFNVPPELLAHTKLELVFEGLDTYADVYCNDVEILSANNMFRTWVIDVKPYVKAEGNTIRIRFRSPIQEGLTKLAALGYPLPATNDDSKTGELGEQKVSIFSRKAPFHYGWDWGPRFVTSGIWKNVYLRGWSGNVVRDLFIRQDAVTADTAKLTAILEIESDVTGEAELKLVTDRGQSWSTQVNLTKGLQVVELAVVIDRPTLWWSRGLGEPNLYTFDATIVHEGVETARKSVRTGLRSVKLIRKPDAHGTSFYFEVNGVAVFAKGANHIPNDSFVTEVTEQRYRHEVASAAESNMNMLRIWGGGIYELDIFYDLCDEYGILVWQDFMFACSMYPGDQAFLDNVRAEAVDNVRRLRNHASIALWCGNNEIDGAWAHYIEEGGWGWKKDYTKEQRDKIWADYEAIFHHILPDVVGSLSPEIDYWPSSPMQTLTNSVAQHATNDSKHGDVHFWAVWHASEPFENYKNNIGRFMSEYGFQSFPEEKTVRTYAAENEMALDSEVMLHHQKNGRGNFLIKEYSEKYMKEPKDFVSFLYMSHVLQAEGMKMAIESHRRAMDYCMGTLYWQMNDCWPVASWSSMDYYGRWKAIQYYAKRSFRDVLVSIDQNEDSVDIHLVSDLQRSIAGNVQWKLYDFAGGLLKQGSEAVKLAAGSAIKSLSLSASGLLGENNPNQSVLVVELVEGDAVLDRKEHYFAYSKFLELATDPGVIVQEVAGSEGTRFELSSTQLAKQVWLQTEVEGIFSDNFFDLIPGVPVTVQFLKRDVNGAAFAPASPERIEVKSMVDFC